MSDEISPPAQPSVTTVPLAALITATVLAGGLGVFGGANLKAPVAHTDLYVHALRIEQNSLEASPVLTAYSTSVRHLLDGGTHTRDEGGQTCLGGPATTAYLGALNAVCMPAGGFIHALDIHSTAPDAGFGDALTLYGTEFRDGGFVDVGQVQCATGTSIEIAAVIPVALDCAAKAGEE